jgi:hypothetical protein
MLRHGPKLERQQLLLGRFVELGTEIFALTATCLRAEHDLQSSELSAEQRKALSQLVDFFCHASRLRIEELFRALRSNADRAGYRVAQDVLAGKLPARETIHA